MIQGQPLLRAGMPATQWGRHLAVKAMAGGLFGALLVGLGPAEPASAADDFRPGVRRGGAILTEAEDVQQVQITVNKSKTLTLSRSFSTVTVGSGEIAEAMPMSDRVLYIQGKKEGTT